MQGELNKKTLRFVNGGNGLARAAYDFNSGPTTKHLHVYLGTKAEFIRSDRPLSLEEQREASEVLHPQLQATNEQAKEDLRQTLLGPDGDKFIADRQKQNSDSNTASSDIIRALGLYERGRLVNWKEVKETIQSLRSEQNGIDC
jgi:hypothetical protein